MTAPVPGDPTAVGSPPTGNGAASGSASNGTSRRGSPATAPPATTPAESALIGAAQDALAAEYEASWGYPVLGPRLTDPTQIALARAGDDAHGALVDALLQRLAALDRTPVAAQADYPLPSAVATPAQAAAYALQLETTTAAAWRFVIVRTGEGTDVQGLKSLAVDALIAAAQRGTSWRGVVTPSTPTVAFPGT